MTRKLVALPPAFASAALCALWLGGCSSVGQAGHAAGATAVLDSSFQRSFALPPVDAPRFAEQEPNDDLAAPFAVTGPAAGYFIDGELESDGDVDIFDLGPAASGTQLSLRVTAANNTYLKIALLDGAGDLLHLAYPTSGDERVISLEHVVRRDVESVMLAIAAMGARTNGVGVYEIAVTAVEAASVPPPVAQIVFLNFAGADLSDVPDFRRFEVIPFDAADISDTYSGMTEAIIDDIVAHAVSTFAGSGVTIVTSLDGLDPSGVSTVHVGAVGESVLGLAQTVDAYNVDPADQAVVFVKAFRQFMYLSPTPEEMAVVVGNVVCHEAGHLLGLNHTQGRASVMDITSPMSVLLRQRYFGHFPLERTAFPRGYQNAPELLRQAVGGQLQTQTSYEDESLHPPGADDPADQGRPLPVWQCTVHGDLIP